MSGDSGVRSAGGRSRSASDLSAAAFSITAAATFGSLVDFANLRRVVAWRTKYCLLITLLPRGNPSTRHHAGTGKSFHHFSKEVQSVTYQPRSLGRHGSAPGRRHSSA